ncbi:MAG: ATP cone domain-containing protein [Anaerolineales bacterium]
MSEKEFENVIKRSGAIVPFNKERIYNAIYRAAVSVGGRDRERAKRLADKVVEYLHLKLPEGHTPHIEEIQDAVEKTLIENGHAQVSKAYILYREDRNRARREAGKRASTHGDNIPWRKIWYVLDWAVKLNLHTVSALNMRILGDEFPQIVHESESAYADNLTTAVQLITERKDGVRLVIVSGPSSSGKTTTTIKIEQRLKKQGLQFRALNMDNYFFDLEEHPQDEFGDYDFETPQALDLQLINDHLQALIRGDEVLIPYYDFKAGRRILNQTPMKLAENEILLLDSLHGLYPPMTEGISSSQKFAIYLEPLLQMRGADDEYVRWADLRLIRRMLRDADHRAYDPERTLQHWHYVRASELRNIIPYIGSVDVIINSAMPYELAIYRHRLLDKFEEWEAKYRDDPLREDAYKRTSRILRLLNEVEPVKDESSIPHDSVLREFIGGSSLSY